MSADVIKIGTRNSQLALWQTHFVAKLLESKGAKTAIFPMETIGDKKLDTSISKIGSKGVFTQELETKLMSGEIDIAIHSAKDLQSDLGENLEVIAYTKREEPHDVLVSKNSSLRLKPDSDFNVGTSSTRRVATLRKYAPQVSVTDMRGNLQTRIAKMQAGECDALILAYAGVHRMQYDDLIAELLDISIFTPAAGQGCIAVEASTDLAATKKAFIRDCVNDQDTETCLTAERSFLKRLQGGCSIPVFGHAHLQPGLLHMTGGVISLNGVNEVRIKKQGEISDPENLGQELAEQVLSQGGDKILEELRSGN